MSDDTSPKKFTLTHEEIRYLLHSLNISLRGVQEDLSEQFPDGQPKAQQASEAYDALDDELSILDSLIEKLERHGEPAA
jgi:hypothetical protein